MRIEKQTDPRKSTIWLVREGESKDYGESIYSYALTNDFKTINAQSRSFYSKSSVLYPLRPICQRNIKKNLAHNVSLFRSKLKRNIIAERFVLARFSSKERFLGPWYSAPWGIKTGKRVILDPLFVCVNCAWKFLLFFEIELFLCFEWLHQYRFYRKKGFQMRNYGMLQRVVQKFRIIVCLLVGAIKSFIRVILYLF